MTNFLKRVSQLEKKLLGWIGNSFFRYLIYEASVYLIVAAVLVGIYLMVKHTFHN
jgi:hypothetical protein